MDEVAVLAGLADRGLLPPAKSPIDSVVGPEGVSVEACRGAILGTAIGDAMGRPAESLPPEVVREMYGELRDYVPWHLWEGGPVGTWTDDTQMTICVAECLIAGSGRIDPEDLSRRFVDWLPEGRGVGGTCRASVLRLMDGLPWWEAGVESAGNGAAMRVAPVGCVHAGDVSALRHDAALSALVTHADPMAVSSAIAQAFIVAWCAGRSPGSLDVGELMEALRLVLSDVHDPGAVERRLEAGPEQVRLVDRLSEVEGMLELPAEDAFGRLYNGAFVLESLPAALWCFLRSPEDAEEVILTAVHGGYDADTVAAMAGAMVGAYLGEEAFPERWRGDELERRDDLGMLAARILDVHIRRPTPGRRRPASREGE